VLVCTLLLHQQQLQHTANCSCNGIQSTHQMVNSSHHTVNSSQITEQSN